MGPPALPLALTNGIIINTGMTPETGDSDQTLQTVWSLGSVCHHHCHICQSDVTP